MQKRKIDMALIRTPDVQQITGWSAATLWRQVKRGNFPAPVKIGVSNHWKLTEIKQWFEQLGREA